MSFSDRRLELSEPQVVSGTTPSTAGTPTVVSIQGNVFELEVYNQSMDYTLYFSLDFGNTWVPVPPESVATVVLGSFPDPLVLVKSDGASQPFTIIYRLRL